MLGVAPPTPSQEMSTIESQLSCKCPLLSNFMAFALPLCTQGGGDQLLPLQKKVMSPGLWQSAKVNDWSV